MPNYQAISKSTHAHLRWQRYTSYSFAAADALAPLVAHELPRAMMSFPIAFTRLEQGFVTAAVQGLAVGKNLFVAPDGKWVSEYIPASYRGYPFVLADTDDGRKALCFDEQSGLLRETEQPGELFFGDDGLPAQAVSDVLNFLNEVDKNLKITSGICQVLEKHDLIEPWVINLKTDDGTRQLDGLFKINEDALNKLPMESFQDLREAGALNLIYCQLLSMPNLQKLGQLAQLHDKADRAAQGFPADINLEFLSDDGGAIKFDDFD